MASAAAPLRLEQLAVKAILLLAVLVVMVSISPPAAAAIDTAGGAAPAPAHAPAAVPPLAVRLHRAFSVTALDAAGDHQDGGGVGMAECWGALTQLSACTSEILLFMFNGESYIGPECCLAIRGATRHCWPAMLASVGYTAEQADVLRGFCEGEAAAAAAGGQKGGGASNDTPPPAAGGSNDAPPPGKQ